MKIPTWYEYAYSRAGLREIVGPRHNKDVVDLWRLAKIPLDVDNDELAWCAAFACACLEVCNIRSTRSGRAKSFIDSKFFRKLGGPDFIGSIVVLNSSRGPAYGHVGFAVKTSGTHIYLLGGNQSNEVNVSPFKLSSVNSVWWPSTKTTHQHARLPVIVGGLVKEVSDR